jgi:hypothetical protein
MQIHEGNWNPHTLKELGERTERLIPATIRIRSDAGKGGRKG